MKLTIIRLNKKRFTMVELLAVIVILGILAIISVSAVQGTITKAKDRYYKSQEENFVMATQSYLQNNKKKQPKMIGQALTVYLKDLKSNKYIDSIVDYKKEECDRDSYVQVFKYEDDIYYTPYIACPNYTTDLKTYTSNIDIEATFTGDENNLSLAATTISIKDNNIVNDRGESVNISHGIISYQYKIYVEGELKYISDVFNAKGTTEISKTISLVGYIPGMLKISVTATNMYGLSITKTFTKSYRDLTPPKCKEIVGDSTTWSTGTRKISVKCDDEYGSGCKKDIYTYEFTGDVKVGTIKIEDKQGNAKECNVNVYIDNNPPVLEIKVYKKKAGLDEKIDNNVVNTIKTNSTNQAVELTVNKDTVGGWLNSEKYPNGVFIEASYDDISSTSSIEWKWNDKNLQKSTSSILKLIKKITPTSKKGSTTSSLVDEGYRQGQIVATDKFGHVSVVNINIPMDRTPPTYTKTGDSTAWTKDNRIVTVNCLDGLSGCASTPGSKTYSSTTKTKKYTLVDNAGNKATFIADIYVDKTAPSCNQITGASTTWTKNDRNIKVGCTDSNSGCSLTEFQKVFNSTTKVGSITISDKVGNTTNCNVNAYVDKTAPTCGIVSGDSTTWTNSNRNISVACNDSHSGCTNSSFSKTFSSTTKTGIITLKDKVGNAKDCSVNAYIDKTAPTIESISGASKNWTNGNRTITVNCNDSGGSGCSSKTQTYTSTTRTANIKLTDGAGNSVSVEVDVYVDKTAPSCNGVWGDSTSWTKGDRSIGVGCSDSDSGCSQESFSKYFNWTVRTDNVQIRDNAGNTRDCGVNVFVDKTPPNIWTSYGPVASRCGGKAGVLASYEVREYESGLAYVGDWWGWDYDFNTANAISRNVGWGSTSFSKTHQWSASCTSVRAPAGYCYRIKVYAKDIAGNEAGHVSPNCSYKG